METALSDISRRGDAAVRELSEKFDHYAPTAFRLTPAQIDSAMKDVAPRDLEDIKFAQEQVRSFARHQMASLRDIEVETMPGVVLGHRHIPVQSVGVFGHLFVRVNRLASSKSAGPSNKSGQNINGP